MEWRGLSLEAVPGCGPLHPVEHSALALWVEETALQPLAAGVA